MPRHSEGTVNYELANALRRRHPLWRDRIGSEQSQVLRDRAKRPDIVVKQDRAPPIILETEFAPGRSVEDDARRRLGWALQDSQGRVEQAIAVRLPVALREVGSKLPRAVDAATLQWRTFAWNPGAPLGQTQLAAAADGPGELTEWPPEGWITGGLDDLADTVSRMALSERMLERSLEILELGISRAAHDVRADCSHPNNPSLERLAQVLHQEDSVQTTRMAMAIVANALLYQLAIEEAHQLPALHTLTDYRGKVLFFKVQGVWMTILREINYWPIFQIALAILRSMHGKAAGRMVATLGGTALELHELGAVGMHDLSGRIFQRLIADRKFLATFYTLPSSAALLAELAVARLRVAWADPTQVAALRIADLACGTGALLSAAYESVLARHRRRGGDDAEIHGAMMERALIGADIMPAATHLTASILSSAHPGATFRRTQIYTMPYGSPPEGSGRGCAIGSLDLIDRDSTRALFGTGEMQARGDRAGDPGAELSLPDESVDLVIMNPPFTRPTNHESTAVPVPSFAGFGTSADEQRAMAERLREVRRGGKALAGHGNAGLASHFIDLAHAKVKPGGVVALVLPSAFTQGDAWKSARKLFERCYRDLTVVSIASAAATGRAFSADTGIAEVMVVATKREAGRMHQEPPGRAAYVNLDRRPRHLLEGGHVAREVRTADPTRTDERIRIGDRAQVGRRIAAGLADGGTAQLRSPALAASMVALRGGRLRLPHRKELYRIGIAPLGTLGERGLLHRDIAGAEVGRDGLPRGPFDVEPILGAPEHPMLWAHHAPRERRLVVAPDRDGQVRPGCADRAVDVWQRTATRLHFTLDFQINSQSLAACLTPKPSIGGRAWPNFRLREVAWDEAVALWANTTLGLMSFWWIGTRQQQGRAVLTIGRLPELPALDPRGWSPERIERARDLFREFEARPLRPASEADRCEVRQALDRAVLVDLLGLSADILGPLAELRTLWCAEPTVHGGKSTPPGDT